MKYNYLIVGAGLFGLVFAREATKRGKSCLVIEKRNTIGGNAFTKEIEGINVHVYGPHIFHTNDKEIWDYVNQYAKFNRFILSPLANYNGELYNLPFNMNTFSRLFNEITPDGVMKKLNETIKGIKEPKNLEERAISTVGTLIYEKLIKEYTEKQWGRDCKDLPSFIIDRLPLRMSYDNNYFNDLYQGIPIGGYTKLFEKLSEGIEIRLSTDYFSNREYFDNIAEKIVYTGDIDRFFDYKFGKLEYRSLRFETEVIDKSNYQGCAVMNFTSKNEPYTRIIEHKHFESLTNDEIYGNPKTVITREYPAEFNGENEPFYPINNTLNNERYKKYYNEKAKFNNIIFGGRLGEYKYYNMDQVIKSALNYWK